MRWFAAQPQLPVCRAIAAPARARALSDDAPGAKLNFMGNEIAQFIEWRLLRRHLVFFLLSNTIRTLINSTLLPRLTILRHIRRFGNMRTT